MEEEDWLQKQWSWNIVPWMNGRARYRFRNHTYPASAPSLHSEKKVKLKNIQDQQCLQVKELNTTTRV